RGERLEVVRRGIDRGDPEDEPADGLAEVHPDAAVRTSVERDVAVAQAPPDPDRGDPGPRTLDPPAGDVRQRRPERPPAERDADLAVGPLADLDECLLATDAEQDAEERRGTGADPDREALDGHPRRVAE